MPSQPQALQRYRLVARLGSGGMADVYLAVARGPADYKKLVVLKVLRPDVAAQEQPGFLQMFLDEGRLAGRLNHPHIIHSYEPGVDAGQHFIAMEYLEGQALNVLQSRWWQEHDAHTVALELFVIAQVLDGLEYAHTLTDYDGTPLNIVHRDVSPQNVFVTYSGHSKLLDFGIAKTLESSQTQGGIVKGKVAYMAPEQVRTRALDHRADLFSVGVMLWECAAGRRMHTDASVFDILKRVGEGDLPKLRDVAPNVPPRLEAIINRALALEPKDRYPDAQSFREAILSLPELRGISARDVAVKLDQLFSKERADLNRLIHEAMSGAEELDLPSSTASTDPAWTGAHGAPPESEAPSNHARNNQTQPNTLPIIANTVASSSPATTAASTVPALVAVRTWRKSAWFAGAALVVLLVGIASFVSTRHSSAPPTPSATNPSAANPNTVSNAANPNTVSNAANPNPAANPPSPNPAVVGATSTGSFAA
ncbi:MAG TPA: protein kinase, partial [Polyangiaceae bacterium]|nr:protein kinase [Polyangiaceae bacterium]